MPGAARDRLWAVGVGIAALAVYVRTLAPGLIGIVDTPMFQFVGRVLGVAHNPGYPLYVLLTYPFSFLPVGTLAYRINLFSALFGAVTVALVYGVARRLGCRVAVSAGAALALAFGRTFWSQSVIAEVYTLNAAIVAGVVLLLLVWRETKRAAPFYGAVALFAAGLGNHITILGLLPGMLAFVWLHEPVRLRRPVVWLRGAGLVSLGLLPYGFILLRSRQAGAYVESPARSLAELGGVVGGAQFADGLFIYDWQTVIAERLPFVLNRLVVPELTWVGLVLALAGAGWLAARQRPSLLLLLSNAIAVTIFIANYDVIDAPVFMIPAFVSAWLLAGVAVEQAARRAGGLSLAAAVGACALVMPGWLLARNLAANDRSRDVDEQVYFGRLFEAIPDGTVLVREDYLIDRMVMYMLLGEGHARRRIEPAPAHAGTLVDRLGAGAAVVVAFPGATRRLRLDGLDLDFNPARLLQGSLVRFRERLPAGSSVALAVPAIHAAAFAAVAPAAATQLRAPVAGITIVAAGELPPGFDLRAGRLDAAVTFDGRDLGRTSAGAVLAVWRPDGELTGTFVLRASDAFEVPFDTSPLSVRRMRGAMARLDIPAGECRSVAAVLNTGNAVVHLPAGASLSMSVVADAPLATRVADQSTGALVAVVDAGGARLSLTAPENDAAAAVVALGAVPAEARACLASGSTSRPGTPAQIMRQDTRGLLRSADATETLEMHRDEQAQLVGAGWSGVDVDDGGPFRWMTAASAHLLLPLVSADVERIELDLFAAAGPDAPRPRVTVQVNGVPLASQPVSEGWARYAWSVPAGLLTAGTNSLMLAVDPLRGDRSVALAVVTVVHRTATPSSSR
jgi:hypothetical protein